MTGAEAVAGSPAGTAENLDLVRGLLLFVAAGAGMVWGALALGRLVRPRRPHPEKAATYECGEPTIGESRIRFDLRFYVVALVFLIFDVELALFYPWAVVYGGGGAGDLTAEMLGRVRLGALADMLFFFGVIGVGFLFLWKHGYLDWVRAVESKGGAGVNGADAFEASRAVDQAGA